MTPIFKTSQKNAKMQIWCYHSYHMDKPNFLKFWVKVAKIILKVKVKDPIFYTRQEYPGMHVWILRPALGCWLGVFCIQLCYNRNRLHFML